MEVEELQSFQVLLTFQVFQSFQVFLSVAWIVLPAAELEQPVPLAVQAAPVQKEQERIRLCHLPMSDWESGS